MDLLGQSNGKTAGKDKKDLALQEFLLGYGEKGGKAVGKDGETSSQTAEEFYNQHAEEVSHSLEAVGAHPRVLSAGMAQSSLCLSSSIPLSRERPDTEVSRPRFVSWLTCCTTVSVWARKGTRHSSYLNRENVTCKTVNCIPDRVLRELQGIVAVATVGSRSRHWTEETKGRGRNY